MIDKDKYLIFITVLTVALVVLYMISAFLCALVILLSLAVLMCISGSLFYANLQAFIKSLKIQGAPILKTLNPVQDTQSSPILNASITAIEAAIDIDRAFIWGGTRSGKTYFCKQLAYARLKKGDMVFAIDPKDHDPNDHWPEGVVVVGASENYDGMADFWRWIEEEKARRGADMKNIKDYPSILIFFDEISVVIDERPGFQKPYIKILRMFAQYKIGLFAIGQTDDVKSIGLKGLVQIKECFEAKFAFNYNKFVKKRISKADLKDGFGMIELKPYRPVNFITGEPSGSLENLKTEQIIGRDSGKILDLETPKKTRYLSEKHKIICESYLKGLSYNKICQEVWGVGAQNGNRINKIKAVLGQYGVELRRI